MSVVKYLKGKNAKRTLDYLLTEESKSQNVNDRVLGVSLNHLGDSLDGMMSDDVADYLRWQMEFVRANAGKKDKKQQIHHIVQSFDASEADYRNADDIERCNALGFELAKSISGDVQCAVFTQADNENNLIHNHIVLNGVQMDGRSLPSNLVRIWRLRDLNDSLTPGNKEFVASKRASRANGAETIEERRIHERGGLTQKDELREAITYAKANALNGEMFESLLSERGVSLTVGKSKGQPNYKFKIGDSKNMTKRALGDEFAYDVIQLELQANERRKREREERRRKAREYTESKFGSVADEVKGILERAEAELKGEQTDVEVETLNVAYEPVFDDYSDLGKDSEQLVTELAEEPETRVIERQKTFEELMQEKVAETNRDFDNLHGYSGSRKREKTDEWQR